MSDFLDKGTDDIAKVLQWKSPDPSGAVRQGYVCVCVCVCVCVLGAGGASHLKEIFTFFATLTVSYNVESIIRKT